MTLPLPLIELQNVSYWYNSPAGDIAVLNNLYLSVAQQEWLAVTGPSGSGKTTLLNLIGLLDYPKNGNILFDGTLLNTMNSSAKTDFRKKNIGMVFQYHCLLPQCTVLENILLPTLPLHIDKDEAMAKATALINTFKLDSRSNHFPCQLSGGECQRVAVARAIVNSPRLILADEPTGALDSSSVLNMLELLHQVNANGTTIIMVTHSEQAASAANKSCHLVNGMIM
jgi:putative ABC transport system ATP-binding protein